MHSFRRFFPSSPTQPLRAILKPACVAAAALLGGCTVYAPRPLSDQPTTRESVDAVQIDPQTLHIARLREHRFDPDDGLDAIEVEMLAVAQNPDLKIARADLGVARAQAFAAGLLPDPQASLSRDFPRNGGPGNTTAFNLGATLDIGALIAASATRDAARGQLDKVRLDLLWQEWQTMTQARLLFARVRAAEELARLLTQTEALYQDRATKLQAALTRGDVTIDAVAPNQVALEDVRRQINDNDRALGKSRADLTTLLGLAPGAKLPLTGDPDVPTFNDEQLARARTALPQRRGDLLALRAGYASQEARVRQAVLAQFPVMNFGFSRARDTAGLFTNGFSIAFTLPLFNRNRGNIAIEQATRKRLAVEYQARLDAAYGQIDRTTQELQLVDAQIDSTRQSVAALQSSVAKAARALGARGIDVLVYTNLQSSLLAKQGELVALRLSDAELRIALSAILGTRQFDTPSTD
ncbi:MAG: TolC family protein [Betaproteobacteria bacterium]|nr:TolC family protein [Betaproteobacteria bacterium]